MTCGKSLNIDIVISPHGYMFSSFGGSLNQKFKGINPEMLPFNNLKEITIMVISGTQIIRLCDGKVKC